MLFEKITYSEDFPINIRITKITDYPLHYHKDVEFVYVLKGSIHLKCICSNYVLHAGDIFINNSREVHSLNATDEDNIIAILQISTRYFTQYFPSLHKGCFMTYVSNSKYPKLDALRKILLHILLNYTQRSFNYKSICISQMIEAIRCLNQNFNLFAFDGLVVTDFRYDNPVIIDRISKIINYVYANHSNKITLESLAKQEHLSTYYLSHFIRNYMGISFQEFLCFARVEMSEIPLLQTNKKISVIAKEVGFSTTAYYEKFFTKWFKSTPQEHRDHFLPHVLSEENPAACFSLSKSQSISILKRSLSAINDCESSSSQIKGLTLNIDVLPDAKPIMDISPNLQVVITCEDYHIMGERMFNILYELKPSLVILNIGESDSEATAALISNRLNFMGYKVLTHAENGLPLKSSYGFDTIASAINAFLTAFSANAQPSCCKLRDQGSQAKVLKGMPGILTSGLISKPAFYAYRLLQNIKGKLIYWGKYYYIIKNDYDSEDSYTIIVLNYNDNIRHMTEWNIGPYEASDIISNFMNELSLDFKIPLSKGQYIIAKYAFTNSNSIFSHMASLRFPDKVPLADGWIQQFSTEPQTQSDIEEVNDVISINASVTGAGIEVFVIRPFYEE